MKVKDLRKILFRQNDNLDVVVVLNKEDVQKINRIAETNPAVLILDTEVSEEPVNDMFVISVKD